jgi:hypothetical protein
MQLSDIKFHTFVSLILLSLLIITNTMMYNC